MNEMIKVRNVSKEFKINKRKNGFLGTIVNLFFPKYEKKLAVDGLNITINKGETVAFIGANGAGKSTTIKMLSGILYPTSGDIVVDGMVPYKQRKKYVSNIGVVLGQKSQLVWDLPVIDSFELIKYIYKISDEEYKKNLQMFVSMLNMDEFIHQPVRQLSLGQKMRAEIVAAMLHSPKIVFLDEPTIGLDVVAKLKIQEFIKKINKELGVTIIFTTHDMQDILQTCERIIIIDKGKKIFDGAIQNVKHMCDEVKKFKVVFEEDICIEQLKYFSVKKEEDRSVIFLIEKDEKQIEKIYDYLSNMPEVVQIELENMKGGKKRLHVLTEPDLGEVTEWIWGVSCEKIEDGNYYIYLKDINSQIGELIQKMLNQFQIKDMVIEEPELAEIVYNIYEGKASI